MDYSVLLIIIIGVVAWLVKRWIFNIKRKRRETITEMFTLNLMHGNENVLLFSNEIIGVVCIAVHVLHKFIIKNMRREI